MPSSPDYNSIDLRSFCRQAGQAFHPLAPNQFANDYDVAGRIGLDFEWQPLPNGFKKMKPKECFRNCISALFDYPNTVYCEGYVTCVIPIHHAWLVEIGTNKVIELTMEEREAKYLGIPFKTDYLIKHFNETGSLLENWQGHFPIATGKHPIEQFWHPAFERPIVFSGSTV